MNRWSTINTPIFSCLAKTLKKLTALLRSRSQKFLIWMKKQRAYHLRQAL